MGRKEGEEEARQKEKIHPMSHKGCMCVCVPLQRCVCKGCSKEVYRACTEEKVCKSVWEGR